MSHISVFGSEELVSQLAGDLEGNGSGPGPIGVILPLSIESEGSERLVCTVFADHHIRSPSMSWRKFY